MDEVLSHRKKLNPAIASTVSTALKVLKLIDIDLHCSFVKLDCKVLGNALFGTLFLGAVFRMLGPGLGGLMVLLAGSAGNLATALFYGSFHSSVGASTAIFGAIGLLGGHGVVARRREGKRKFQVGAPAAAGLALLAMIGMSERADWIAHLTGLVMGGALGLGQAIWLPHRPGVAGQWMRGGISVAVILGCWAVALK